MSGSIKVSNIDTQADSRLKDLLPPVVALAREAGEAILKVYREMNPEVVYKRDNSPLTRADMASHHLILAGLTRLTPEWPVLSEESAEIPFAERGAWEYFWMVDPLDGTKEFLSRNGEFTVNIALMKQNAPILGVVYAPVMEKMYFAAKGHGAWRSDGDSPARVRVANGTSQTLRVMVSRSHKSNEEDFGEFTAGAKSTELIPMGSSLKFCFVAEGAADLYPRSGPTMEWDTAAAQCIVEEAGGSVAALDGSPLLYNKASLLNPGFVVKGLR